VKSVNVPVKKCVITLEWITISCLIWVSFLQQVSVIDICSLKRHLNQISHVNQIKLLSFAIPRRIDVGINVLEKKILREKHRTLCLYSKALIYLLYTYYLTLYCVLIV